MYHIALRLNFLSSTFTGNKDCRLSGLTERVSAYGLLKESRIDGCEKNFRINWMSKSGVPNYTHVQLVPEYNVPGQVVDKVCLLIDGNAFGISMLVDLVNLE